MAISLSPEIQKLIEEEMERSGFESADEFVRFAIETMPKTFEVSLDELDEETRAAIERADAEEGEGIPLDEAFARLRAKLFDK